MAESPEFKKWHKLECLRRSGEAALIEKEVDRQMSNIKVEGKENGKWIEIGS